VNLVKNKSVLEYLVKLIEKEKCIHVVLLDPEKININKLREICQIIEKSGSKAILVGGSTGITESLMEKTISEIKQACSLPVIIFPNNLSAICKNADAIFFMSLLNSQNPYYLIEVQMQAAPIIKKYQLETIPVGYIIAGEGGAVSYIGWARPIPYKYSYIIAAYAMAAEMLGMKFIYIEGGSGVKRPIPSETIKVVRENINIPLIIGGGIKTPEDAKRAAQSGANIIVTGTLLEKNKFDNETLFKKLTLINEAISSR
jgi:phosphoglycerol geranylgeranyltransferase